MGDFSVWEPTLAHILSLEGRVLVLGATDAGKSTFCWQLLAAAVAGGRRATLVDADVGQKMVGPPAAVTVADAAAPDDLADLAFVGTTDPVRGFRRLVDGVEALSRRAPARLLVVNTSGLVSGVGRRLKAAKIAALKPDLLVAVGNDPAVEAILAEHPEVASLRLPSSPAARRKPPGARRVARREAFRRHIGGGTCHVFSRAEVSGPVQERHLVSLVGPDGRDLALGVVRAVDPDGGRVRVQSLAPPGAATLLVPGAIRLREDYEALPLRQDGKECGGE